MQNRALIREKAKQIRKVRKLHRITGVYFLVFILIITITGLLLAWKKNADKVLYLPTQTGISTDLTEWLSLDDLLDIARNHYLEAFPDDEAEISRIDARPGKGIVKILFEDSYYELQLDGKTGDILSSGYRVSDIIENIHDGSIIDYLLSSDKQLGKLIYSSILGLAALVYSISGFYLWYQRKKIRKLAVS
jgi:uncharacterized iron-regulated membrane protein